MTGTLIRAFRRSALMLALLIAWQVATELHVVSAFLLPSPMSVARRLGADAASGQLALSLAATLYRALLGFAIAGAAGVALGILMARVRFVHWLLDPLVSVGLPMPKIVFLPVFVLWFGVFDQSKILMVAFSAVFPVIAAAWAASENVDKYMLWSARGLGAGGHALLWEVALPAALPEIMTGLQVALPIALIVAVVTEMVMGGYGLGGAMMTAWRFANSAGVFAGIVEIAAVGYLVVKGMALLRRRLLIWHAEAMEPSTA